MTEAAEDPRTPGSVPNSWGNALAWRWSRDMPPGTPSAFLALLYALRAIANASGQLRFRDGRPMTLKDFAAASRVDVKDVRRYRDAAVAAGVLAVLGEQRRGRSPLHALVLAPYPDWTAAADVLSATKRKRPERKPPPWRDDEKGGRSPVLDDGEKGGRPPLLQADPADGERGAVPPLRKGGGPPPRKGGGPPNNPGIPKKEHQGGADVGPRPQESSGRGRTDLDQSQGQDDHAPAAPSTAPARCPRCDGPMITRPGRPHCGACERAERRAS